MLNTIVCPNCGKPFELSQAYRHAIEEEVERNVSQKHKKELEEIRVKIEKDLRKQIEEKSALEKEDLLRENREQSEKIKEFREKELNLREEKRRLEEREKDLKLEVARKIDEEKKKIEEEVFKRAFEDHRLKDLEKDKVIGDLKKALDEAKRKAEQGSQQLQGEILELDIETTLRTTFPHDTIEPIAKGTIGADIRQTVKSPRGRVCGTILWESKRTKVWSDAWIAKLKADMLADKASLAAIVSETLPIEAKRGLGDKNGIWITNFDLFIHLSMLLRKSLLDAGRERAISENRQTKAEAIYSYIAGDDFRHQIEMLVDTYQEMKGQIFKERVAFEKSWKVREQQVNKVLLGISGVYGSLQGIAGSVLPTIKKLELESGEE